mmetsp:Transcript_36475/g.100656  ORF Transcript_36475/g.100656 Transcript_36475/m.100656 type:complete len:261 (-) Transcript_36475:239-1021(-)
MMGFEEQLLQIEATARRVSVCVAFFVIGATGYIAFSQAGYIAAHWAAGCVAHCGVSAGLCYICLFVRGKLLASHRAASQASLKSIASAGTVRGRLPTTTHTDGAHTDGASVATAGGSASGGLSTTGEPCESGAATAGSSSESGRCGASPAAALPAAGGIAAGVRALAGELEEIAPRLCEVGADSADIEAGAGWVCSASGTPAGGLLQVVTSIKRMASPREGEVAGGRRAADTESCSPLVQRASPSDGEGRMVVRKLSGNI